MNPRRLLLLAVSLLAFAVTVQAALPPPAAEIRRQFDAADTTRNGAISAEEWDAATAVAFQALDKNSDHFLDRDELAGLLVTLNFFAKADADHDGKLSADEFTELRHAVLNFIDIDRDDNITYVEFELLALFEHLGFDDKNHNGRIEPSELRTALAAAFAVLDTNHDGELSPDEAAYFSSTRRTAMLKTGNGHITAEAYIATYRQAFGA